MKTPSQRFCSLLLVSLLSAAPGLLAQEKAGPEKAGAEQVQALIEQLGAEEHSARQEAEKQLRKIGDKARAALRKAAESDADPEVQWRARRLLRRLDESQPERGGLSRREGRDAPPRRPQEGVDEVERLMERMRGRLRDFDGLDRDLDQAMKQLRESMRELQRFQGGMPGLEGLGNKKSMKMSTGPDGVRVEVVEVDKDGKEQRKVYEAEDMESFKKKHPGILDQHGLRIGGELPGIFRLQPMRGLFGERPKLELRTLPAPRPIPGLRPRAQGGARNEIIDTRGPKLGVYLGEVDPAVRAYLEIQDGRGLMVQEVVDGSLAAKLGVKPGDILLDLDGVELYAIPDVRRGLERGGDGPHKLQVIRKGRKLTLKTKAAAAKTDKKSKRTVR